MRILHLYSHINKACGISRVLKVIFDNSPDNMRHFGLFCGGDAFEIFQNKYKNRVYKFRSDNFISELIYAKQLAEELDIEVIHSHTRKFDFMSFLIQKMNKNIKTITTAHYFASDLKYLSYKADRLIAVSELIKKNIVRNYKISSEKIDVIYNPYDKELTSQPNASKNLREEYGIADSEIIACYVGRFEYSVKYLEIITNSLAKVLAKRKDLLFFFVGDGKDKERLIQETEKHRNRVKIIPSQLDMRFLYDAIDIVIIPSPIEPFGLTAIEAGLFSKAVLANAHGAPGEYLSDGHTATLFDSAKESDFESKLLSLCENSELRKRLGSGLNKLVFEKFNERIFFEKLEQSYLRLFENKLFKSRYIK